MDKKDIAQDIFNSILQLIKCKNREVLFTKPNGLDSILIYLSNNNNQEIICGDIAKYLNISTARVAVALKSLQNKGLIKKYHPIDDKRKIVVTITQKGIDYLKEKSKDKLLFIEKKLDKLTLEESIEFKRIFNKLIS